MHQDRGIPAPIDVATINARALLQALPIAAALIDDSLRYIDVNRAYAELCKLDAEGRHGMICTDALPIAGERLLPLLQHVLADGHPGDAMGPAQALAPENGEPSWLNCRCRAVESAQRTLLLTVEKVAPPSEGPQALSEQRLRNVLDNIFTFVGVLAADGTVLEANRASLEAAAITLDEVRGRKFWECYWWSLDADIPVRIRHAVERAAAGTTPRFDIDKRLAGDNFVAIDLMLSPVHDASGVITHLIYSATDVSARKAGEAALLRSEHRFRQVVEAAPDGLAMVDREGCMVLVNTGMENLFGFSRNEMLGQRIEMLMPDRHRGVHGTLFHGYMSDPSARDMAGRRELYARRSDGSEFPVEIGLNPIRTESGTMVLATIQDVTTRKADRQLIERALEEKTVLLNEVHHRVKNNLQVISSLLNLQARGAEPGVANALAESQGRVKAMALIHQLLYERNDFSQVDLSGYLRRLCALFQEGYRGNRANFSLRVDAPGEVYLNLQSAVPCGLLVNELVTNAVKHAFPDQRVGHIDVGLVTIDDQHCMITVADDGIGLPEDVTPGVTRSLGMQLIPLLSEQANGRWAVFREHGTRFELHIETGQEEAP